MVDCGKCSNCGSSLTPVFFEEEEWITENGIHHKTGRTRKAVDVLVCPICLKEECVDGDFLAGPWMDKIKE